MIKDIIKEIIYKLLYPFHETIPVFYIIYDNEELYLN